MNTRIACEQSAWSLKMAWDQERPPMNAAGSIPMLGVKMIQNQNAQICQQEQQNLETLVELLRKLQMTRSNDSREVWPNMDQQIIDSFQW